MDITETYEGQAFSFRYPADVHLFESPRPDGSFLLRLIVEHNGIRYRYDLERLTNTDPASKQAVQYFQHQIIQPEDVAPEKVQLSGMEAWHTRKVVFDGLEAVLIYDAIFMTINEVVYRFQYMAYSREFNGGLPVFENVVRSLTCPHNLGLV